METLLQDIRVTLRAFRRSPGFPLTAIATLALGIGATTAIFTTLSAVLLKPLPYPEPQNLYSLRTALTDGRVTTGFLSGAEIFRLNDSKGAVERAAGYVSGDLTLLTADGTPVHVQVCGVTEEFFPLFGLPMTVGGFSHGDFASFQPAPGAPPQQGPLPAVVISTRLWKELYNSDPAVVGKPIRFAEFNSTVSGVAPRDFEMPRGVDIWIAQRTPLNDANHGQEGLMRLRPGATLERAKGEMATVMNGLAAEFPKADRNRIYVPRPLVDAIVGDLGPILIIVMSATGLLLLLACGNVANLLLARGAARSREVSVRMALGAGRVRLVRQLLTEHLVLAALGGALGLLLAVWGSRLLLRIADSGPGAVPLDVGLDVRVLGFTLLVTALTALLFGLIPAVRATRVELAATLRANSRGLTGGLLGAPGRLGLGKLLVVFQVALSLTLLVGTSMLVRSTRALSNVDPGLARDRLLIVTVDAAPTGLTEERLAQLSRELLERVGRIPGVAAASFSENGIFSGTESYTTLHVEGFTARSAADSAANYDRVGPGYFDAIGARLIAGRDIAESDNEHAPHVTVINSTMASAYFPNGGAIGHRIKVDSLTYEIVGVVADTKDHELRGSPTRRLYLPIYQAGSLPVEFTFELRATGDPATLVAAARRELTAVNSSLLVTDNDPLALLMRISISQDLLVARVASFFGTLALALAALGLYGVMMYATLRRTSEFGLRMALGAEPRRVRRMVLGEAMALVLGGTVLGVPLAIAATRLLRNQLFGVELLDLPSIVVALAVLAASAAIAGYVPATRAARVGPLDALRTD
jgi:predicted permease